MSPRTSLITAALSSIALVAAAAPAAAQQTRSVEVEYLDLDLTHPKGEARLQTRIKSAARTVCGPAPSRSISERQDYNQCIDVAINGSQKAVVTLLAEAKSPNKLARASRKLVVRN